MENSPLPFGLEDTQPTGTIKRTVEQEPTPEPEPQPQKFSWLRFLIISLVLVAAWVLGQFTPWFPDELAVEIAVIAIYELLGKNRR